MSRIGYMLTSLVLMVVGTLLGLLPVWLAWWSLRWLLGGD